MQSRGVAQQQHGEAHGASVHRQDRGIVLLEGSGAATELWLPTLERRPLSLQGEVAVLKPSGLDNYHLLYASKDAHGTLETALRYHYMNGKPSKRSPAEIVNAAKSPLDIVPSPLAREHARYLSGREATFEVRFHGQPIGQHPIALETSNGTRWYARTESNGRITFVLPDDFAQVQSGREFNLPADFVLHVSYMDGDKSHRTSLSAPYHVNPGHWQSSAAGYAASFAGFMTGILILGVAGNRLAEVGRKERRV